MLTILHISDIHLGPAYVPEVGEARCVRRTISSRT